MHSPTAALSLFDASTPLTCEDMLGTWKGGGFPTGHPMDGLLGRRAGTASASTVLMMSPSPRVRKARHAVQRQSRTGTDEPSRAPDSPAPESTHRDSGQDPYSMLGNVETKSTTPHGRMPRAGHGDHALRRPPHRRSLPEIKRQHRSRSHGPARKRSFLLHADASLTLNSARP